MFAFSLLLLLSIAKSSIANQEECLKLLCNPDESDCHPCTGMSADELGTWRRYIDALLQNFNDEESNAYYRQIREEPFCCSISPGERCIIKLIKEPNVPPHRLYEMGCVEFTFFPSLYLFISWVLFLVHLLGVYVKRTFGSPSVANQRTRAVVTHPSAICLWRRNWRSWLSKCPKTTL